MSLQRYDLVTNYRAGSSIEEMERADDGEWVRWEAVEAELVALRAARDTAEQERDEAQEGHRFAQGEANRLAMALEDAESACDKLKAQLASATAQREALIAKWRQGIDNGSIVEGRTVQRCIDELAAIAGPPAG